MRNIPSKVLFILLVLTGLHAFSQKVWQGKSQLLSMYIATEGEDVEAHCNTFSGYMDFKRDSVFASVKARDLKFTNPLQEAFFLREVIRYQKYPLFELRARLPAFIDVKKDTVYRFDAKADLRIRDTTVRENFNIKMEVKRGEAIRVFGTSSFLWEDLGLNIPPLYAKDMSEEVKLSFRIKYLPEKRNLFKL